MMSKELAIEILEELIKDNSRDAKKFRKSLPSHSRFCEGRAGAYRQALDIVKKIDVYPEK